MGRIRQKTWPVCGFTLVELMVVVALIAILASLLLPALARAKALAHNVRCQNNAKQLSLAMLTYVAETSHYPIRGWFMEMFRDASSNRPRSMEVAYCPSDRMLLSRFVPAGTPFPISYGQNFFGMSQSGNAEILSGQLGLGGIYPRQADPSSIIVIPQAESAVVAPSEMIALGDGIAECRGQLFRSIQQELGFNFQAIGQMQGVDSERLARVRHNSRANIAFADGHIERMPFATLFGETDEAFRRWNVDHLPHRELRVVAASASKPK